eukprot:CAMPEP_0185584756 /NCGR_PEP_ID=MMETSP0434-20130131/33985_1 /TAXON_ID=626734 ORGANISM="Favella taraikaensis, Strain Fe Narragansett Bay" /NCGR_SAMPLE_ID=MMETSP0434 /ASSEMBLY_ACC=CAM_ASM_000379 /LENGTH=81 /DNA_ID=CAMNT_0028204691 /DNA_START=393 /DNA_END=638 /DNA_ORIENTATION=-
MEHVYKDQLGELTLLAGDGDFRDLVLFLNEKAAKKVHVFSYEDSHNSQLHANSTQGFFLDSLWDHISVPPGPNPETGRSLA